ncbi:MAG TPA: YciI family protein [Lautropia sp.]|nr:YciI family protein [Lautropia sp.]
MQYMLMFFDTPEGFAQIGDERAETYWAGWNAYIGALAQSGAMVKGDGLQLPHTATSVRVRGEQRHVQDGPFADSKEQLGGYVVIDVADLDAALDWASRAPCASSGGVEVRPILPPPVRT